MLNECNFIAYLYVLKEAADPELSLRVYLNPEGHRLEREKHFSYEKEIKIFQYKGERAEKSSIKKPFEIREVDTDLPQEGKEIRRSMCGEPLRAA